MKEKFLKKLWSFMFVAIIITIGLIFVMTTVLSRSNIKNEADIVLHNAKESIEENKAELEELKDTLNEEYIEKAKIVSYIVKKDPEIIYNYDELLKIEELLCIDEIHIFDSKGIIVGGTVKEYYGFDANSGEQSRPFLEGISNKDFELAQEAQPNVVDGKLFQYIGVARIDEPGIIQIGIVPEKLQEKIENIKIKNVLKKYTIGENGSILVINKSSKLIEYFKNPKYIEKNYNELGLPDEYLTNYKSNEFINIDGKMQLCIPIEYGDYILCAIIPKSDVYENRLSQIVIVAICIIIIFIGLSLLITNILDKDVINGINAVIEKLNLIKNGDLNVSVDVLYNKELKILSDGINSMLQSIKNKMEESSRLYEKTETLLESQEDIMENVKISAKDIKEFSNEILDISKVLKSGTVQQECAVEELSNNIQEVFNNINVSCNLSNDAKKIAETVSEEIHEGNEKIQEVVMAMNIINDASSKISDIINEIQELSSQSNLLALNASIEASKAGEQGKSFSVIAGEVGELANRSKESAINTNELIKNTLDAINEGNKIVEDTVITLKGVMNKTNEATNIMNNVAIEIKKQESFIVSIKEQMKKISFVVEKNSDTAENSEMTSLRLAEQAEKLNTIINN